MHMSFFIFFFFYFISRFDFLDLYYYMPSLPFMFITFSIERQKKTNRKKGDLNVIYESFKRFNKCHNNCRKKMRIYFAYVNVCAVCKRFAYVCLCISKFMFRKLIWLIKSNKTAASAANMTAFKLNSFLFSFSISHTFFSVLLFFIKKW